MCDSSDTTSNIGVKLPLKKCTTKLGTRKRKADTKSTNDVVQGRREHSMSFQPSPKKDYLCPGDESTESGQILFSKRSHYTMRDRAESVVLPIENESPLDMNYQSKMETETYEDRNISYVDHNQCSIMGNIEDDLAALAAFWEDLGCPTTTSRPLIRPSEDEFVMPRLKQLMSLCKLKVFIP